MTAVHPPTNRAKTCDWFCSQRGEDKPLKYPTIFNMAGIVFITKLDLASAVDVDRYGANLVSVPPFASCWVVRVKE